jgi:hypothetical protein
MPEGLFVILLWVFASISGFPWSEQRFMFFGERVEKPTEGLH